MKCFLGKFAILLSLLLLLNVYAEAKSNEVLIFGKTLRQIPHGEIIPKAGPALAAYLTKNDIKATFSQNTELLTDVYLEQFATLILLDVSEGIFDDNQKKMIESYFKKGHGIVSIHASISAGKDWPWMQNLLGTKFVDHPPMQTGTVTSLETLDHLLVSLPKQWQQTDEWYNFSAPLDLAAEVLISVDENSFQGGKMGNPHPIAWRREVDGGKFAYTAMGHSEILYNDENSIFLKFLLLATQWTLPKQKYTNTH